MATEPGYRFIKVHQGFPEHWKTAELSDRAFRDLITAWCFCLRNMTDGFITDSQSSKLFSRKSREELLKNYMRPVPSGGYQMHEFEEHQLTTDKVADLREKRAAAGKRGGKAAAIARASAKQVPKQTGSKDVADRDGDVDRDVTTTSSLRSDGPRAVPEANGFDEFWAAYPRKDDKVKARAAYVSATKRATPGQILTGAVRYRDDPNRELAFTKHPTTWLRAGSWDNPPLPPRSAAPTPPRRRYDYA